MKSRIDGEPDRTVNLTLWEQVDARIAEKKRDEKNGERVIVFNAGAFRRRRKRRQRNIKRGTNFSYTARLIFVANRWLGVSWQPASFDPTFASNGGFSPQTRFLTTLFYGRTNKRINGSA